MAHKLATQVANKTLAKTVLFIRMAAFLLSAATMITISLRFNEISESIKVEKSLSDDLLIASQCRT